MNINALYGVGEKMLDLFQKMNIYTIEELVTYYPYRYTIIRLEDIHDSIDGSIVTIKGIIDTEPKIFYVKRNLNRMTFRLNSDGMLLTVTIFNRAFLKMHLKLGRVITVVGKYEKRKGALTASDIRFEIIQGIKIEPVYHLVNGIKKANLEKIIDASFKMHLDIEDYIPSYLVEKYCFLKKWDACYSLHHPKTLDEIKKARLRTIYEEFFIFMFKMQYLKYQYDLDNQGVARIASRESVQSFLSFLPFQLTVDQESAVWDIYEDLVSEKRMNRLLLGDVGSGKTVVAEVAMYINYLGKYQSAMMAPTEILARQHYENMQKLYSGTNIRIGLLVGSMKKREKNTVIKKLETGEVDIVVGTHALLSEKIVFKNLGLIITDEQHRFGVNQRNNLQNKGVMCDVLCMSATPIPRTYALTIYGDMDTSLIKTKPNGRKDIITKVVKEKDLKDVLFHMLEEIKAGHQVYVVAPLIEDEEGNSNVNDVKKLKEKFDMAFHSKIRTEILNGKMKNAEKDSIMEDFKSGDIKVLISTTVIEVGVDVKNSTMMVIFNAERFGLATLHQLRGRVGRNALQSYCYLICNMDIERLKVMEESNDGFYISQKDFELRGEGDLFGTRQSGDMAFKMGDIRRDYRILEQCRKDSVLFIKENYVNNFSAYPQYQKLIKDLEFIN